MYDDHTGDMFNFEFARAVHADRERQIEEAGRRRRLLEGRPVVSEASTPPATPSTGPSAASMPTRSAVTRPASR